MSSRIPEPSWSSLVVYTYKMAACIAFPNSRWHLVGGRWAPNLSIHTVPLQKGAACGRAYTQQGNLSAASTCNASDEIMRTPQDAAQPLPTPTQYTGFTNRRAVGAAHRHRTEKIRFREWSSPPVDTATLCALHVMMPAKRKGAPAKRELLAAPSNRSGAERLGCSGVGRTSMRRGATIASTFSSCEKDGRRCSS